MLFFSIIFWMLSVITNYITYNFLICNNFSRQYIVCELQYIQDMVINDFIYQNPPEVRDVCYHMPLTQSVSFAALQTQREVVTGLYNQLADLAYMPECLEKEMMELGLSHERMYESRKLQEMEEAFSIQRTYGDTVSVLSR